MSSPSAVEVIAIPEVTYGVTPTLGTASGGTVRFTSEALSGTPTTTESQELRVDRMSGGQVVTGLESGGDINFELSKDELYDQFLAGVMMSNWVPGETLAAASTTLTKVSPTDQTATLDITGDTGDFNASGRALLPGDVLVLSGFVNAINNGPVQVISVLDANSISVIVPREAVTETVATGVVELPDYVDIGSTILSWTMSKAYTDVLHNDLAANQHSQRYTGSLVNTMNLTIQYGEIVNGTFGFLSNGYTQEYPSLHQKVETAGGTIDPAGTANPLNGSVDMTLVTVGNLPTDFCIQTLGLQMSNNATPQNCIGKLAPTKYVLGRATISINASIYLSDTSYDKFMPGKLSQVPISILSAAHNADGGYAFDLRAVQLSFPDPSVGGDQPVLIEASGVAKVGDGGASAIRIWKW